MVSIEYANAYREVLEILKYISQEDYEKIPNSKIEIFEMYQNKNYAFNYDTNKINNLTDYLKAKTIIGILFRDYWATDEQREKIIQKQNHNRQIIEEQKRKLYDPNNLFKEKRYASNKEFEKETKEMIIYKESRFKKFFKKISNFLRRF